MDVLAWHVATQLTTPEQQESELLFPGVTGGYRAASVLNKVFEDVTTALGFPRFTQRGLRRTFQDLARAAEVEGIVTRSISGHATERMQEHYSTVHRNEQTEGIAKVIQLFALAGPASHAEGGRTLSCTPTSESRTPNEKAG